MGNGHQHAKAQTLSVWAFFICVDVVRYSKTMVITLTLIMISCINVNTNCAQTGTIINNSKKDIIMNLHIATLVAVALISTTANAQTRRANNDRVADQLNAQVLEVLRAGQAPVTPVAVTSPVLNSPTTTVTATAPSGVYLGVNAGSNFRTGSDYQVGGSLGYQFTPNYAAEITYDYNDITRTTNSQAVMFNGVYSRRIGTSPVTPYALVGAGMGWNGLGVSGTGSNATLYNVGAGMRVNLLGPVDLDARYRYMAPFDYTNGYTQHVLTGGVRVNF